MAKKKPKLDKDKAKPEPGEFQTSKEELQSMNDELSTVNAELQSKVGELEQINEDLTNVLSSSEIATLFLDAHLRIKLFTPPAGRLMNLSEADQGRPISGYSASLAGEHLVADARLVLDGQAPIERELWSQGPEKRCYLRRVVTYRRTDHRTEGIVVTFVDITKRKTSDVELEQHVREQTAEIRAGRRRVEAIIETAVDAIVTIDERGTVQLFNPAAEEMFGYGAEEVVGKNVKLLMPASYAEEHDAYLSKYGATGLTKIIGIGREVEGKRKDGSTFPIDLTVSRVEDDGVLRYVGTMRDLTALKAAQEGLRREHALSEGIVSTAHAIILRLDQDGRIVSFNPYMEELCGYSLEEVRGKDWFSTFIPEHELDRIKKLFRGAIRGKRTRGNINAILTRSGEELLVEWYDALLEIPGEPATLIAIGHDVSARERLQREYLQAQKMEAVGRLAGGVAHDFNNLLAGILGGIRIATEEIGAEHPARPILVQVTDAVERGASITRRLLDFSRVGKPKPSLIDLRETISVGQGMVCRLIGEDVQVRFDCDSGRSRIVADAGQIEQAVLNLAINARDAMPRGGTLDIRCFDQDLSSEEIERMGAPLEPGAYVVVSVEDSGCGMDEETRRRALEPFFTTKDPGMGTGLGLSSVATMVHERGGHLALESEVGVGTTVRLFFPRLEEAALPPASVPALPRSRKKPAGKPAGEPTGETILLVEDENLVRLGVQHMLEQLGYVVLPTKEPAEALELFKASRSAIDLLLTDVILPGMSGPELAATILKRQPDFRVLFMSAFPAEELVAQGRIAAGTITLEKPFSEETVKLKVRAALDA